MFSRLDRVVNAAIIVACVLVSASASVRLYRSIPRSQVPRLRPGDVILDTKELAFASAPINLLIVTTSSCEFCTASMPFYRRLFEIIPKHRGRIIAVTREDPDTNRDYLKAHGIPVGNVINGPANGIRIAATPTLVAIRHDGSVIKYWRGRLSSEQERDVINTLASKSPK